MGQTQRTSYLAAVLMFWLLVVRKSHASVKSSRGFESDTWESQVPGFEFIPQYRVSAAQPQVPHYPSVHSEMHYLTLGPKALHSQPNRKDQGQRKERQPALQPQAPGYQLKSLPWSPNYKEQTQPAGLGHQQRPLPLGYSYLQKPRNQVLGHLQRPHSQNRGYLKVSEPEVPSRQQRPQIQDHGSSQKPNSLLLNQQQGTQPGVFSFSPKSDLEGPSQQRTKHHQNSHSYFLKPQPEMPAHQQRPQGHPQKPQPAVLAQQRPPGYLQKPQPERSAQQRPPGYLQKSQPEVSAQQRPPGYLQKPQSEMPSNRQRIQPSDYFQKPHKELSTLQRRPQMPDSHEKPVAQVLRHQKRPAFQSLGYPEAPLARVSNYQLKPQLQIHGYSQKPEAKVFENQQRKQVQSHGNPNKPQSEVPSHHRRPQTQGQSHQQMIPSHGARSLSSNYFKQSVPQTSSNQQEFQQGGLGYQLNSQSLPQSYQQRPGQHKEHQEPNNQLQSTRHKLGSEAQFSDLQQNPLYLQRPTYQEQPELLGGRSKQQKSSNKQELQSEKSSHQMRPALQGTRFVQGSQRQMPFPPGLQPQGTAQRTPQAQEEYKEASEAQFPNPLQGFAPRILRHRQGSMAQQQGSQPHTLQPQGPQASDHRHGPWLWPSRYAMFGSPGSNHKEE